ncbi:hypothetical protein ACO0R3_001804 [Hanseniaspora guilliermondii]
MTNYFSNNSIYQNHNKELKEDKLTDIQKKLNTINTKPKHENITDQKIDVLPTPNTLFIPKRNRKDKAEEGKIINRISSVIPDNFDVTNSTMFSNLTNTINRQIDGHPTLLDQSQVKKQRDLSAIDIYSPPVYEKQRHISAPITLRNISSTNSSEASVRIYNSTNHFSPTTELNTNLILMNTQYLDNVMNQNQVVDEEKSLKIYSQHDIFHNFKRKEILGAGNFSDVYRFVNESTGDSYACKYIKYPIELLKSLKRDKEKANDMLMKLESSLLREIKILNEINMLRNNGRSVQNEVLPRGGSNIIELIGVNDLNLLNNDFFIRDFYQSNKKLPECYIMTDYCPGGNLLEFVKEYKLSVQMIHEISYQTLLALNFLHQNLIIHRDVKLENILLTLPSTAILDLFERGMPIPSTLVKLSDFGLSKKVTADEPLSTTRCGSPDYIPPEILLGLPYDGRLTDVWSFGVCLYAILEEMLPFDSNAITERQREMCLKSGKVIVQKRRGMSDSARISRCDWKWYYMSDFENTNLPEDDLILIKKCKNIVEKCLLRRTERYNTQQLLDMDFFL